MVIHDHEMAWLLEIEWLGTVCLLDIKLT